MTGSLLFIKVDKLVGLVNFEILIEHLGGTRQIEVAREEKIFEESLLGPAFVVDYVLTEAALSYSDDHSLRRGRFTFLGRHLHARRSLPQKCQVSRLEGDYVIGPLHFHKKNRLKCGGADSELRCRLEL